MNIGAVHTGSVGRIEPENVRISYMTADGMQNYAQCIIGDIMTEGDGTAVIPCMFELPAELFINSDTASAELTVEVTGRWMVYDPASGYDVAMRRSTAIFTVTAFYGRV